MARLRRGGLIAAAAIAAATVAPAADASFPGRNGKIAVSVEGCGFDGNLSPRYIQAYGPAGRKLRRLTDCDGDRWGPDWAPAGRRLAVGEMEPNGDYHFAIMHPDGSHRRRIAHMPELGFGPSFLPSGLRFLYVNDLGRDQRFFVVSTHGGFVSERFTDLCDPDRCPMYDARVSPGGRRVAVGVSSAVGAKDALWVARLRPRSGKAIRRVARGGVEADWAPDGRHLVYRSAYDIDDSGAAKGGNLYVAGANGRHRHRILRTHDVVATEPTWSPNGRWIAFVRLDFRDSPNVASMWKMRVSAGSKPHRIGKPRRLAKLPKIVHGEDEEFRPPRISWQPLPRRGR
jgi:Tol biopolymer transport system component